jgi:hypothetical protein
MKECDMEMKFTGKTQADADAAFSRWLKSHPSVSIVKQNRWDTGRTQKAPSARKNDSGMKSHTITIEFTERK